MSDFLTFLDLTARQGADAAIGLVEEVQLVAPELMVLSGRPIKGTTYRVSKRETLPGQSTKSSVPTGVFRKPNQGVAATKSKYTQIIGECFFLDGQMQVDEAIVTADDRAIGDVLADEGAGQLSAKVLGIGAQTYYGTNADSNGFVGFQDLCDSTMRVNAGGSTGLSSAYLVWNNIKGVHYTFGNAQGLQSAPWLKQQVRDSNSNPFMAYCSNAFAWIGLASNYTLGICRIANLDQSTHGLTDKLVAQALALFPINIRPTHLFANRIQRYQLQQSRTPVYASGNSAITAATALQFAPLPTESNGIPLHVTDSLVNSETAVSFS